MKFRSLTDIFIHNKYKQVKQNSSNKHDSPHYLITLHTSTSFGNTMQEELFKATSPLHLYCKDKQIFKLHTWQPALCGTEYGININVVSFKETEMLLMILNKWVSY